MRGSYSVALVGFSQQDALTLESFLRAAGRYTPGFLVQDEVMDAQILIVNADSPHALHLVRHAELPGRVLLIGNADGGTGWPLHRRPINRAAMRAELERILSNQPASTPLADQPRMSDRRPPEAPMSPAANLKTRFPATEYFSGPLPTPLAPATNPRRRTRDTEFQSTQPMRRSDPTPPLVSEAAAPANLPPLPFLPERRAAPTRDQRPGVMRMTDFGALDELPMPLTRALPSRRSGDSLLPLSQRLPPEAPESPRGEVLLVAESLVEGRILLKRFKRYDLSVDWSREPAHAVEMLKKHPYRLVVIDRLRGPPDAFQVCRAAKQEKRGGRSPVVVMFAAIAGSMDRMKAGLAGCDAYLSRSVSEADLYKLLAQHRLVNLDAFARTNIGV